MFENVRKCLKMFVMLKDLFRSTEHFYHGELVCNCYLFVRLDSKAKKWSFKKEKLQSLKSLICLYSFCTNFTEISNSHFDKKNCIKICKICISSRGKEKIYKISQYITLISAMQTLSWKYFFDIFNKFFAFHQYQYLFSFLFCCCC